MSRIRYRELRKHWKYQLGEDYSLETSILSKATVSTLFVRMTKTGKLTVLEGYAWDGPSGPMRDDKTNMRGSLVHDALYQLIRMKLLPYKTAKTPADELFRDICIEDGMSKRRARRAFKALQLFGKSSAKKSKKSDKVKWQYAP